MADNNKLELRKALSAKAEEIDEIASNAVLIYDDQTGSFAKELAVAQAVVDMRVLLTDDVMAPIMALANTDLGFRTDKDPHQMDRKTGQPNKPYPVAVVREVFIESKLRGFHTCGNEFNIIAGRFYAAQNGFKRKVRELTGGTYEPSIDTPVIQGEQAKIKCRATWSVKGTRFDIGLRPEDPCEFLVRINAMMGPDAIIGKAERKLSKRVYERITGRTIPEGDASEADGSINVESKVEAGGASGGESPLKFGKGAKTTPTEPASVLPKSATSAATIIPPVVLPTPEGNSSAPGADNSNPDLFPATAKKKVNEESQETPQEHIKNTLLGAGVSFDAFRDWLSPKESDRYAAADSLSDWDEIPNKLALELIQTKAIAKCILIKS